MRRPVRLGICAALVLSALGPACRPQSLSLHPGRVRLEGRGDWPVWPESFRLVHRIELDVRGRRMDFLGYLAVKGEMWRAIAVTELGGKVFEFLDAGDGPRVLVRPRSVPRGPLENGVMQDLALAFTPRPRAAQEAEEPVAPLSLRVYDDGGVVSETTIEAFTSIPGWPHPVPERLKIVNRSYGYSMTVGLIRMDLRPVDDSVFKGDRGP
jgi:hypothetical protein